MFTILENETNTGSVDKIIARPIRCSHIGRSFSHHIFVVINSTERNFSLIFGWWYNETFLRKQRIFVTTSAVKQIKLSIFTTWISTPVYASDSASIDRRKKSSDGAEWFHHETNNFIDTRFSTAATLSALSMTGQYLLQRRFGFCLKHVQCLITATITSTLAYKWSTGNSP